jgi:hypothetical protein
LCHISSLGSSALAPAPLHETILSPAAPSGTIPAWGTHQINLFIHIASSYFASCLDGPGSASAYEIPLSIASDSINLS